MVVIAIFAIGEGYLRSVFFGPNYFIHIPGSFEFDRKNWQIGLEGKARFSTNRLGLRGEDMPANADFKMLTFGSSGVMGWMLDDGETWPEQTAQVLRQKWSDKKIWVGNAAKPGNRLVESFIQLRELLDADLEVDLILVVGGASELMTKLYRGSLFKPIVALDESIESQVHGRAFTIKNGPFSGSHLALFHLLDIRRRDLLRQSLPPNEFFKKARLQRSQSITHTEAPNLIDLKDELMTFQNAIQRLARRYNKRTIFLTRPTFWKPNMSGAEESLLWFGHAGENKDGFPAIVDEHREYYSAAAMYHAITSYNALFMANCKELQLECFDLNAEIEKNTQNFFDDAHLTPGGSRKVAEIVAALIASD